MAKLGLRDARPALSTLAILAISVGAVYGRALRAPFIFDDTPAIVNNPSIVRLWPLVGDSGNRGPLNPPPLAPTARRPLPNLTFALNYRVGGLDPVGYRAVNVVLHVLSAAVLAALVRRTLRLPYFVGTSEGAAWVLSLAVALVWAVHPLNTEAVVYVTQRTELLVALFFLTTLWAAVRHWTAASRATRSIWLGVAIVACLAGMMSKEIMVAAPLVVLLYERTFLTRSLRATSRSWPLYVGLALGWVVVFLLSAGGVSGLSDARHQVPLLTWWMTQAKVVFLYLKLTVWPWPLSIHYTPTYLTFGAALPWLLALAVVAAAALVAVRRRPAARFLVMTIVLVLAPTLVVPLPKMLVAERRMYLPLAGLVALAIVGVHRLLSARWPSASTRLPAVGAAALAVALSSVSVLRLAAYETAVTIWQDAVQRQPDDPMSHYNLGVALVDERRPVEAMGHFQRTLRLDPEHTGALDNLGRILTELGRPQEAMVHLERALTIEPGDAVAHNNLGAALITLGRSEEAIAHLHRALAAEPDGPKGKVHLNLGKALIETGRTDEAIAQLEKAVAADPDDADAHYSLGVVLSRAGRPTDAIGHLEQALAFNAGDPEIHDALASMFLRTGRPEQAVEHYRRALALKPDYPEARNNLGTALLDLGRKDEAIGEFQHALRLNPDHANAHYNLANVLLDEGRPREAIEHFQQVLRVHPDDPHARFACAMAFAQANQRPEATAMAEEARALARAQADSTLADRIGAWLGSYRAAQPR